MRNSSLSWLLVLVGALSIGAAATALAAPRQDRIAGIHARRVRALATERASRGAAKTHVDAAAAPAGLIVSVWAEGGAAALAKAGFRVRAAAAGDVAYLDVSPDELDALSALPSVRSVEEARVLHSNLDRSGPAVSAPMARTELGLDGRGAIVGVVDTGLDFRHADFRRSDGSTRLLALLDVSIPADARHPELGSWPGAVWLTGEIQAQLDADQQGQVPSVVVGEHDTDGHGTHVTGIAAGGGLATANQLPAGRYVGIAPGAAIVAVKAARQGNGFYEQDVLDGLRFVFDRATAANLPAVVNLSIGAEGGPHDGTSNFERAISATSPAGLSGRAIVVAAGNGGTRDQHAGGYVRSGSISLDVPFPSAAALTQDLNLELWSDVAPASITVIAPSGTSYGPALLGKTWQGGLHDPDGQVGIDDASTGADPINHRFSEAVSVAGEPPSPSSMGGVAVAGGTWKLVLDWGSPTSQSGSPPPVRWDAWLTGVPATATAPRFVDHLDEDDRADLPAFAERVMAVGSYVTRNSWTGVDTRTVTRDLVVGRASSFSGTGPASDGRFLPDLSAPGDFVLSSISSDAPPSSPSSVFYVDGDATYLIGDDGLHGALRGTSQAAPHVAGAIALLFSIDPMSSFDLVREQLRASATVEADAPGYSTRAGFGRLDVLAAARLAMHLPTGPVDPHLSSVGVNRDVAPAGGPPVLVSVVPRDAAGAPLGAGHVVKISSDAGQMQGAERDLGGGRYERTLLPVGADGTIAHVSVQVDGVTLATQPTVWFATDRSIVGAPTASHGCSIDDRRSAGAMPGLWLLFAAVAVIGSRRALRT